MSKQKQQEEYLYFVAYEGDNGVRKCRGNSLIWRDIKVDTPEAFNSLNAYVKTQAMNASNKKGDLTQPMSESNIIITSITLLN